MAKPIFILHIPIDSNANIQDIYSKLSKKMFDYHIIINVTNNNDFKYECLNDCKGLPDIDIEKLIKDFTDAPNKDI